MHSPEHDYLLPVRQESFMWFVTRRTKTGYVRITEEFHETQATALQHKEDLERATPNRENGCNVELSLFRVIDMKEDGFYAMSSYDERPFKVTEHPASVENRCQRENKRHEWKKRMSLDL